MYGVLDMKLRLISSVCPYVLLTDGATVCFSAVSSRAARCSGHPGQCPPPPSHHWSSAVLLDVQPPYVQHVHTSHCLPEQRGKMTVTSIDMTSYTVVTYLFHISRKPTQTTELTVLVITLKSFM